MKEKGTYNREQASKIIMTVENYTNGRDAIVCKRYGVDPQALTNYIKHY